MNGKIKVMIVDDSAVVRYTLAEVLSSDPEIEVVAMAADPFYAAESLKKVIPDVITLDIEMPRMDGLTFLKKIMTQYPIPIIICSSLALEGAETTLSALELGAVDIITKPKIGIKEFLEESKIIICDAVKAAKKVNLKKLNLLRSNTPKKITENKYSQSMIRTTEKVVVVGASTGGTEAIRIFLEQMPVNCPGIVIVQHMPEKFTNSFANRLNSICSVEVKEAEDRDSILRGRVLIAPGNKHTYLKRSGAKYFVEIKDGPLVRRHRPSVDVLFESSAYFAGANVVGVIMTGMGNDGAHGMSEMKKNKAYNIAQDEESCVVFGMPNEAIKMNAVDIILPIDKIAEEVLRVCG